MRIHVECLPDETLAMALGVPRKRIVHHAGKSRVFAQIKKEKDCMAIVDEDPGSARCSYERSLSLDSAEYGMEFLSDKDGRKVIRLAVKLEDWVLARCVEVKLKPEESHLPSQPNELHRVVNSKLDSFSKLIAELLNRDSPGVKLLRSKLK